MKTLILGMASHDLSNVKTTILRATLRAIPGNGGNPNHRFSFAPSFSERFFKNWGGPRAPETLIRYVDVFWDALLRTLTNWMSAEYGCQAFCMMLLARLSPQAAERNARHIYIYTSTMPLKIIT